MNLIKRAKIAIALIREYGLRKIKIAHKESSNDRNYVLIDCPKCGTEHRIHKLRASRGFIRCTNCRTYFIVIDLYDDTSALMRAFKHNRR